MLLFIGALHCPDKTHNEVVKELTCVGKIEKLLFWAPARDSPNDSLSLV